MAHLFRCRLHHKDTNFKANHNLFQRLVEMQHDVDCTTKIRILKQITTTPLDCADCAGCRLHHKDTNFKANHNTEHHEICTQADVDCTTKIRILKQITTYTNIEYGLTRCRLHHKDTNFKANHNCAYLLDLYHHDVDCTTKIRILKQITTRNRRASNIP